MKGVFAFSFALMHSATVPRRIKQSRKIPVHSARFPGQRPRQKPFLDSYVCSLKMPFPTSLFLKDK